MGGGGDKGAKKAAEVQAQASREAVAEQRRQFAITQENLRPLIDQLDPAVQQESALLGLAGTSAQQQALSDFALSPGQQFLRDQGEQALLRNQAAIGGLGGGNVRQSLVQQGQGFASQALAEQLNRLANIRTGGQSAVIGQGQLGAQAAGQIGSTIQQGAAAQASGILAGSAQPSAIQSALSGAAGGVAAGSKIGSIVPGVGTGVGGAIGGAIGGLSGLLS